MAANEIAERLAAMAWIQCGSAGGEAVNGLVGTQIRYRSRSGFQNRIITTEEADLLPVIVLPLDRAYSRAECAVFAVRLGSVGPGGTSRLNYPLLGGPLTDYPQCMAEPCMLEWFGPDLSAPTYMPFGLPPGPPGVPLGQSLELFDAIAVLLPVDDGEPPLGRAGDVCVLVLKHPPAEGGTTVQPLLPAPDPGPVPPLFWWRMDDYQEELGNVTSFNPRAPGGLEGQLELAVPVPAPLANDPLFNNQPVITAAGNTMTPTGFPFGHFDPMGSDTWSMYLVISPRDTSNQVVAEPAIIPPQPYRIFSDPTDDELFCSFAQYGAVDVILPWAAAENVKQLVVVKVDGAAGPPDITVTNSLPASGTTDFGGAPPGTCPHPLFNTLLEGGGDVSYAEIIGFDRVLTGPEEAFWLGYLTARYGAF